MRKSWTPAGRRGTRFVFTDNAGGFRFERDGFRSDVFNSLGEANRLGWAQWHAAQKQQQAAEGTAGRCRKRPADKQPSEPSEPSKPSKPSKPPVAGQKRRLTRAAAAAAAAAADQAAEPTERDGTPSSVDGQCLTEQQQQQQQQQARPVRRNRRSKAPVAPAAAAAAAAAATFSETVSMPARRTHSTPAKKKQKQQPRKQRQANKKAAAAAAAVEPDAAGPQAKRRRTSKKAPAADPAAAAAAAASEGGCSNLITPDAAATTTDTADADAGHAAAAKGGAAAAAQAAGTAAADADADAGQFPTLLALWQPGGVADSGQQLALSLGSSLGRGGFGEVFKVSAKAFGPNSLSELKLRGSTAAAAKQLLERAARGAGGNAGSSSSAGGAGSNSVTLALKLAQPFVTTSFQMQENFFYDSFAYQDHVRERAAAEFKLMTACAASPHIVTAFAAGRIASHDASAYAGAAMGSPWLSHQLLQSPGILMELAEQGDVESALIKPASAAAAAAAAAAAQPPLPPLGPQPSAHELLARQLAMGQRAAAAAGAVAGLGAREAQRVVRAAAGGLSDLHRMARHLHCDVKIGNLLVFDGGGGGDSSSDDSDASGGAAAAGTGGCLIKLCDLGVAKKRTRKATFGPVSGTKDWQAPEQAAPAAGRLDYCLDSWGLGLLVLGLRRGRRPFWWLQDMGVRPFAQPDTLAAGLGQPGCRYAQEEPHQPGSALGPLELAFVRRCMQPSSRRPRPAQLLQDDPYLSEAYQGG